MVRRCLIPAKRPHGQSPGDLCELGTGNRRGGAALFPLPAPLWLSHNARGFHGYGQNLQGTQAVNARFAGAKKGGRDPQPQSASLDFDGLATTITSHHHQSPPPVTITTSHHHQQQPCLSPDCSRPAPDPAACRAQRSIARWSHGVCRSPRHHRHRSADARRPAC